MSIIGLLYSTVGLILAISYLPQVFTLLKARTRCEEISLISWIIWNYTATISLLYSIFELSDFKLSIVTGTNVFFVNLTIAITLYKRYKYASQKIENTDS